MEGGGDVCATSKKLGEGACYKLKVRGGGMLQEKNNEGGSMLHVEKWKGDGRFVLQDKN